ncbi:MAG TPA: F0F1 ATP synthase subunit B [Oceanobacillus sp.]|nr:F0F1 ATP synthase subunit B [Oceanobacillus sp.]
MRKPSVYKGLLLLLVLIVSLAVIPAALAQEEPAGDTTTEEQSAAAESEAQEVEGEEPTVAEGEAEEPATNPLTPLGINAGFLVAQIINFLLIFGLLTALLWRPIVNTLDSRAMRIQKGLEDAAAAANARRNAEAEAESILSAARAEAAKVIEEARNRGEEVARQIEAEARAEADNIRAEARARANEERDRQLADLRGQVASISIAVAQRLLGEALDEKRQQALINDFFSKVPAEAKSLSGSVEVISAMPLDEAEQNRIKKEIGATDATFIVDPGILGGLVIRTQDRVVDGSVRSGLNELALRLR